MPLEVSFVNKENFVERPTVPVNKKASAEDLNALKAAINANYRRLMFDWTVDISDGFQLVAGMYVFFSGGGYQITTSYNVGTPKTWNGANAVPLFPSSSASLGSLEVAVAGGTITLDYEDETDRVFYGDASFGAARIIALANATNARRLDFAFKITNVAAALTWPSNFFMRADPQWNTSTKLWTPNFTGRYLAKASKYHSDDEWLLYNLELPII